MNLKFLLFVFSAAAISSCSTAYKSGQTPDDVYYSPTRVVEESNSQTREEVKKDDFEEREIRMSAYDRRWRDFDDDYNYRYDPYNYGYSYGYYYNPYYCHYPVYITNVAIYNPKNSTPRMTSLGSYNNPTYSNTNSNSNSKYGSGVRMSSVRPYNNSNNGSVIRRTLTRPSNNSSNNYNSTETNNSTRSYTPSSNSSTNSSSSGSSSGSSGTSVSRPARGG
jgi:hypothetical protein